ncbi:MAG: NAD(+)/NADH kinase [Nitrospirota bacterium]|nr:NAD(+)/NADH kinase [Nitrospirota bacterium]
MKLPIRKVGIITKLQMDGAAPVLKELLAWLGEKGCEAIMDNMTARLVGEVSPHRKADVPRLVDLIVVLGGDGTLLSMARLLVDFDVPLLGINLGSLGFLTEVPQKEMIDTLEKVFAGQVSIERRLLLKAEVRRHGEVVASSYCLNDVVVSKGTLARMIRLHILVDGQFMTGLRADGLIVATPTGSTAYCLSAGGPIVHPENDVIVLTPISPHVLTNRPVILPPDSKIEIRLISEEESSMVTFDGQVGFSLRSGDVIAVQAAENRLNLIVSPERNYYEVLRTKLKWGGELVP